jgi:chemotaxis protein methyltransferase CheR
MNAPALNNDAFQFVATFLRERSGLSLTDDKLYLLESRLQPIARTQGLKDIAELIAKLRVKGLSPSVEIEIIEAMTTNESMFFRDTSPFDHFSKVMMPKFHARGTQSPVRIWSAACSTGQEPYSLAMTFLEAAGKYPGLACDILGTDIAEKVLHRAREGQYTQFEVQRGLPIAMLLKYFRQSPDNHWEVSTPLKNMVRFDSVNLLAPFQGLGMFDVIFCRNVLIYFDEKTKTAVLERMADILSPEGFLVLGSAETVLGLTKRFAPCDDARGVFVRT